MIKIWRFSDAPKEVQCLYAGEGLPDWAAELPAELNHLSSELFCRSGESELWSFVPVGGTIVYFGAHSQQGAASIRKIS
jgi:hypothetical protein